MEGYGEIFGLGSLPEAFYNAARMLAVVISAHNSNS